MTYELALKIVPDVLGKVIPLRSLQSFSEGLVLCLKLKKKNTYTKLATLLAFFLLHGL